MIVIPKSYNILNESVPNNNQTEVFIEKLITVLEEGRRDDLLRTINYPPDNIFPYMSVFDKKGIKGDMQELAHLAYHCRKYMLEKFERYLTTIFVKFNKQILSTYIKNQGRWVKTSSAHPLVQIGLIPFFPGDDLNTYLGCNEEDLPEVIEQVNEDIGYGYIQDEEIEL